MKYALIFCLVLGGVYARGDGFSDCVDKYAKAAEGVKARNAIPGEEHEGALLSYRGPSIQSYEGFLFKPYVGLVNDNVFDVAESDELTPYNAAMVVEFLLEASNDSDFTSNQFMALQLRHQFPNVIMSGVTYRLIRELSDAEDGQFCSGGKLKTWKQIRNWIAKKTPSILRKNPTFEKSYPLCKKTKIENENIIDCSNHG
jgi:hypothetical protein